MKKFNFKNIIFGLIIVFSALSLCLISMPNNKQNDYYFAYPFTFNEVNETNYNGAITPKYTEEGNIPFSLYTTKTNNENNFNITEYFSTYSASTSLGATDAKTIYYYSIEESSIPYIMLSSNSEDTERYNKTVVFKFNDLNFESSSSGYVIPNEAGFLSVDATINGDQIYVDKIVSTATNNSSIVFELNLQSLIDESTASNNSNAKCPLLIDGVNFLGGNGINNDVSFRTGLYEFKIRYSFKDSATNEISNECVFETAFYVLDYYAYTKDSEPLTFTNTNTYKLDGNNTNYEIFNYNYSSAPTVEIDATKFAPNFLYTTGYLNYNFKYQNFNSLYNRNTIENLPFGTKTGEVVLKMDDSDLTYRIPTYKSLPNSTRFLFTYNGGNNPFSDNVVRFYDEKNKVNYSNSGMPRLYSDSDEKDYPTRAVWVDDNNTGTFDSGDWFYIERYETVIELGTGYVASSDHIWFDKNSNGLIDLEDIFYLDANENGRFDEGETYISSFYSIENMRIEYLPYYAKFDLQDFETNFLIPNKINTTFLGTYSFDLDFLIQNSLGGYSVFDNSFVPSAPEEITSKKLLLFGYNLKYYDQDASSPTYHQNVELKNDYTWTNFISYNTATEGLDLLDINDEDFKEKENGNMKNIPSMIAITNQAPLRFDYFGNLTGSNYTASSCSFDYKSYDEDEILEYFFEIYSLDDLIYFDEFFNNSYYQGAAISSDGIKILKLEYRISVTIDEVQTYINGCQYFCFEINNTIQNLYIQAIDYDNNGEVVTSYDFNKFTNKDVRINIEYKPNTFFVPVTVSYNYYRDYSISRTPTTTGNLSLKTSTTLQDGLYVVENYKYEINGDLYNYFVLDNSNKFTFTESGTYKIVIKNNLSNVPVTYYFTIDKDHFNGVEVKKATLSNDGYVLDDAISSTLLTNGTDLNKYDLLVSDKAFSLGWNEKQSGASSYSYVYYMEMKNSSNLEKTLFNKANEFWLTNGYLLTSPSGAIDTYVNYKAQQDYANKYLKSESYFNKDGLYIFYVYDEAGNFFVRSVLIDTTLGKILQGHWDKNENWVDTFDPISNPANYVNDDTTLYFGTHKAISLPNLSVGNVISFDDKSFTRAYNLTNKGVLIENKPKIEFDLYGDILNLYTTFVQNTNSAPIIKNNNYPTLVNSDDKYFFLTLKNTLTYYEKKFENGEDGTGAPIEEISSGNIEEIYVSRLYKSKTTAMRDLENFSTAEKYKFYGEAEYKFLVTNINGLKFQTNIQMNFDVVRGTFYAYNKTENSTPVDRLIRKNSGTNLDVLKFVYDKIEGETADYYALSELSYEFYEFVLDESSFSFNSSSYPFSSTITKEDKNLLNYQILVGNQYVIDGINLNAFNLTEPGKYIITRTYVGGNYNYTGTDGDYSNPNNFTYVGTRGDYYQDGNGNFINLFEDDTKVRKYVVYVDHYGIISENYMIRNDEVPYIREVGNFISLTLNNTYDDEWNFKEFFLMSSSLLSLDTNKVPVKVNIPLSKFFVFYNSSTNNLYAKQSFAKLNIVIYYQKTVTSNWKRYVIDGFDSNGMCTCSDLPNGELLFSAEGTYRIVIEDNTGYLDITSNAENADNLEPTSLFGSEGFYFTISHTAPYAEAKQSTFNYNENKFNDEETLLNAFDGTTFATNIKEENFVLVGRLSEENYNESFNEGSEVSYYIYENGAYVLALEGGYSSSTNYYVKEKNNELFLSWSDPITPYTAKIKQIAVTVYYLNDLNSSVSSLYTIDLNARNDENVLVYNLPNDISLADNGKKIYLFEDFEFIKYLEISFFNNVSSPTTYDHEDYFRYSYKLSLNIKEEYKYKIDFSYVSNSSSNQSYKDENGISYANSLYTVYVDRTKPNTNIDMLLNSETYLISSGYYTNSTINKFKEENFEVSLDSIRLTPSAFTYSFAVPNDYKLTYNSDETMPYFFVRNYNKYNVSSSSLGSNYSSITPDMVDYVYNEDKAYYDKNLTTKFPSYYPRFSEINSGGSVISIGNDSWYIINYQNNVNLKNLIITATNTSNPVGFYEIIERDLAGNYRCYTVYFNEFDNVFLNLDLDGYTQKNNTTYLISSASDAYNDNISASVEIELTRISSHLGWGTISIKNETANVEFGSINLTPFEENFSDVLSQINNFVNSEIDSRFSFKLLTYNNNYKTEQLSRFINFDIDGEGVLQIPMIEEYIDASTGKVSYNIVLPTYDNTSILYLEEFRLNLVTISQARTTETTLNYYSSKEDIPNKITSLDKGIYKAIYKDNFNDYEYYYILHIGEFYINDFDKEYSFEFTSYQKDYDADLKDYVYYSGGKVDVTYESNIYNVYVNNVLYSGTNNETTSSTFTQCMTFSLSPSIAYTNINANDYVGGYDEYLIEYKDIIDGSTGKNPLRIRIYNVLPEIILTNAYGSEVTSTLEENDTQVINSIVNLNWGYLCHASNQFEYYSINDFESLNTTEEERNNILLNDVITSTLYKRNDDGNYTIGIITPRGQVVTEEGYYKLVLKNSLLGNYREIYFIISFTDVTLYSVYADDIRLNYSSYETFNLTYGASMEENNLNLKSNNDFIINVLVNNGLSSIDLSHSERERLYKQLGFSWNNNLSVATFNSSNIGICNLTNVPHFYSIYTPKVIYNSNINLKVVEFNFRNSLLQNCELVTEFDIDTGLSVNNPLLTTTSVGNNYYTTIFLLYNLDGPIRIEFFAFTKVPRTSSVIGNSIKFLNEEANQNYDIQLSVNPVLYTLTNREVKDSDVKLMWNSTLNTNVTWYNQGNVVVATDRYGYSSFEDELNCYYDDSNSGFISAMMAGSGVHTLVFKDVAGNVHEFASNTYYPQRFYTINLIDSVIYHINVNDTDYNPIQYGVFNDEVNLVIEEQFVAYYSELNVEVVKNGVSSRSSDYKVSDTVYSFSDPGKYTITLSASYGSQNYRLNDAVYNFTIINKNSARLAYEFVEINGYEILEVIRSEQDITGNFKDKNGRILSLFISSNSSQSGNGYYTIKLKYGNKDEEVLIYSFLINDFIPTISCNVAHGDTTTGNIVISYNPSTIYEQLGDCYIKVLTYNNDSKTFNSNPSVITIDANSFTNSNSRNFEITRSNSYFIQVETKNGNILTSFRVNKKDPLNTVAIIIIVIAAIAVVILVIVIIKLRTRMKIK